jgi:hypothetical protein
MTVERTVVGTADRILEKQPKHIPVVKRGFAYRSSWWKCASFA